MRIGRGALAWIVLAGLFLRGRTAHPRTLHAQTNGRDTRLPGRPGVIGDYEAAVVDAVGGAAARGVVVTVHYGAQCAEDVEHVAPLRALGAGTCHVSHLNLDDRI